LNAFRVVIQISIPLAADATKIVSQNKIWPELAFSARKQPFVAYLYLPLSKISGNEKAVLFISMWFTVLQLLFSESPKSF
jgi:hypothetical protein